MTMAAAAMTNDDATREQLIKNILAKTSCFSRECQEEIAAFCVANICEGVPCLESAVKTINDLVFEGHLKIFKHQYEYYSPGRRDLIEKTVSAETSFVEQSKRLLAFFCVKYMPHEIDGKDCVVVASIMAKVNILKLDHIYFWENKYRRIGLGYRYRFYAMRNKFECKIDRKRRIVRVDIDNRKNPLWHLPTDVARLEQLEAIGVSQCGFIPLESLQKLPRLRILSIRRCDSTLFENFAIGTKLENLKQISVVDSKVSSSSPFFQWMAKELPNLEKLKFYGIKDEELEDNYMDLVEVLQANDWCFGEKLKMLSASENVLNNESFATLFLDILPTKFPNLTSLFVDDNVIESVQPIVDRIKNGSMADVASRSKMRRLSLNHIIIQKLRDGNLDETAAVVSLLEIFNKIDFIGCFMKGNMPSDIKYALSINHAGRFLFEGNNSNRNGDDGIDHRSIILPSLCPLVLARANATGVFYLLQKGLLECTGFGGSSFA